ncbi:hypothetical protein Ddye_025458 [Dipteronia dyeriana]|uniref:Reverse transcriptase zinc-binding domain-containing protein n=1 Tax=Dipteronia dyeriana TaxID=168575 RepID=A0AAD9TKT6_9ROSI|nr:hypothetical protein Ddye_025458 [Dipteronia dyeriana]
MGFFSIQSANHFGCSISDASSSSGSGSGSYESWWKYLWRLELPVKIILHIWRACRGCIPIMTNLAKRGLQVDHWCSLCGSRTETTIYALWRCPVLKVVRRSFVKIKDLAFSYDMSLWDFLVACKNHLMPEEMELLCVVLWRTLYWRNAFLHEYSSLVIASDVIQWGLGYGFLCSNVPGKFVSESVVILRGLHLATNSGLWPFIVEIDSQLVVSMINPGSAPFSEIDLIIDHILDFMNGPLQCRLLL